MMVRAIDPTEAVVAVGVVTLLVAVAVLAVAAVALLFAGAV